MNLQQLEYFVALARDEQINMTNTAKQLNTSQPNLSYSMNELEKELGVPLLKKAGRNIKLTKYGELFFTFAQKSLKELNNGLIAINDAINPHYGEINFGYIYTMGARVAPNLVQEFLSHDDNSNLNFAFRQGNSTEIINLLLNEAIDIGLCSYVDNQNNIEFTPFLEEELVLVVPENHELAKFDAIHLKDTMSYPYILFDQQSGLRPHIDKIFSELSLNPLGNIFLDEDHSLLGFISADFGIGILPRIPSINTYPVKIIEILDQISRRYIYIANRKDDFLAPATKRFKDFLIDKK